MQKLLVASQKGGVGKTTTSINLAAATALAGARVLLLDADPLSNVSTTLNLAQHAQRQPLRQAGVDLPGVLVCDVVPGLDVLSPYEDGGCSDDALDDLLRFLDTPAFQEHYSCLVVDTPPFLGANPGQLLATCDEFVLVMRAEPMAYRTLPAFLELIQRSRKGTAMQMKGILLTLPEGESPGGRWERELRGRFGGRILPHVIPYDGELGQTQLLGQVVASVSPQSPAASKYHLLAQTLSLAAKSRGAAHHAVSPLLRATAPLEAVGAGVSPRRRGLAGAAEALEREASPVRRHEAEDLPPPVEPRRPAREELLDDLPPASPHVEPEREPDPAPPPLRPGRSSGLTRRPVLPPVPVQQPAAPAASGNASPPLWLLWVGLGAVFGFSVRFLKLPPNLVPVVVGIAVAAGMVVVLRLLLAPADRGERRSAARGAASTSAKGRSGDRRKLPVRREASKDVSSRLAALARRPPRPFNRDES